MFNLCLLCAVLCLQTAEGLPGHTGPAGRDHRGLLEDAVGAQLHHRRHANQATRDGTGNIRTHTVHKCTCGVTGPFQGLITIFIRWFGSAESRCSNINSFQP